MLCLFVVYDASIRVYPARYIRSMAHLKEGFSGIKKEAATNNNIIPSSDILQKIINTLSSKDVDYEVNGSICGKNMLNNNKWLIREKGFPHVMKYRDTFHARRLVLLCNGDVVDERKFSIRWPERYRF